MRIFINQQQNQSFKQIKLSDTEYNKSNELINKLSTNPADKNSEMELFDIFSSHLDKEVDEKTEEFMKLYDAVKAQMAAE